MKINKEYFIRIRNVLETRLNCHEREKFIICSTESRKSLSEIPTINDHAESSMPKDDVEGLYVEKIQKKKGVH